MTKLLFRMGWIFWSQTSPNFSTFRITNIGMDFGISSNKIEITDSNLLLDAISENPEKVWALFSEEPVRTRLIPFHRPKDRMRE